MMIGVGINSHHELLILTELCEEKSLRQYISKYSAKISVATKCRILFDIAKAMFYMHNLSPQIIHRDIKLDNIFITANFKAKLGDFG